MGRSLARSNHRGDKISVHGRLVRPGDAAALCSRGERGEEEKTMGWEGCFTERGSASN